MGDNIPEMARHLGDCLVQSHEWGLAWQRLHTWLTTYVGPRASHMHGLAVGLRHPRAVVGRGCDTVPVVGSYGSGVTA